MRKAEIIKNFIDSNFNQMELIWKDMGYKNFNSARSSFGHYMNIKSIKSCFLVSREDRLFLIKNNLDLSSKNIYKFKKKIVKKKNLIKEYLKTFMNSDLKQKEINWKNMGYKNCNSARSSFRIAITNYGLFEIVCIRRYGDKLIIIKNNL